MRRTRLTLMLLTALALPASALADTRPAPELRAVHAVLELQPALARHAAALDGARELAGTPEEVSEAVAAGTPQLGELLHADAVPAVDPAPVPPGTLDPDVVGLEPVLQLLAQGLGAGKAGIGLAVLACLILAVSLLRRFVPALSSGTAAALVTVGLGVLSTLALALGAGQPLTLALVLVGVAKAFLAMGGYDAARRATAAGQAAMARIRTRLDVARVLGGGPRA